MYRFYTDSMFGKLARFLRLLGYDTLYRKEETIDQMIEESKQSDRIIISSSQYVNALCRKQKVQSIAISDIEISNQLKEIFTQLESEIAFPPPVRRCSICNGTLSSRNKSEIIDRIPEGTSRHHQEFWECDSCSKIFWLGRHWEDIKRIVESSKVSAKNGN